MRAKGFTLVRAFVRDAISRKPRIRFWWFFAQSCILIKLKKCSKRIFEKNSRFRDLGGFTPQNAPFWLKWLTPRDHSFARLFNIFLLSKWVLLVSRQRQWELKDSRSCVRSSVRDAISRKPRIRFWWFFAQSCILIKLKKCSKRIFEKNSRFWDLGGFTPQNGPFWLKWLKNGPF